MRLNIIMTLQIKLDTYKTRYTRVYEVLNAKRPHHFEYPNGEARDQDSVLGREML